MLGTYGLQNLNPRKSGLVGNRHLLLFSVNAVPSLAKRFVLPSPAIVSIFGMAGGASGSGISSSAGGTQRHVGGGGGAAGVYLRHPFGAGSVFNILVGNGGAASTSAGKAGGDTSILLPDASTLLLEGGKGLPMQSSASTIAGALGGSPSGPWDLASKGGDGGGVVSGVVQPAGAGENSGGAAGASLSSQSSGGGGAGGLGSFLDEVLAQVGISVFLRPGDGGPGVAGGSPNDLVYPVNFGGGSGGDARGGTASQPARDGFVLFVLDDIDVTLETLRATIT